MVVAIKILEKYESRLKRYNRFTTIDYAILLQVYVTYTYPLMYICSVAYFDLSCLKHIDVFLFL